MNKVWILAGLSTVLASCQVGIAPLSRGNTAPQSRYLHAKLVPSREPTEPVCNNIGDSFKQSRGSIDLPILPQDGQGFGGATGYAANNSDGSYFYFAACDYNFFDMVVPRGYTPDWFGMVPFSTIVKFTGESNAGYLFGPNWDAKATYFMFVYSGGKKLLKSYKIGPVRKNAPILDFASPFRYGFTVPPDKTVDLEIVHSGG
jgi:hypothetical protein